MSSLHRAARRDLSAARTALNKALAAGTDDARRFWHAGEIALARGATAEPATPFARSRPMAATLTPSESARLNARAQPPAATRASSSTLLSALQSPHHEN